MSAVADRWRGLRRGPLWTQVTALGVRAIDLPSRYAFHLIVAAQLGVAAAGGFYIAFSVIMLAAGFGRLGVDRATTRAVARAVARDQPDAARAAIARAFRTTVPLALAVTATLLLLARPLAVHVLAKPELASAIMIGAAVVMPLTIGVVAGGALAGLHRLGWSLMVYSWLWPALFCVAALLVRSDVERALATIAGATALNAAIGIALLLRFLPERAGGRGAAEPLLATGLALFSSEVVQLLLGYAPTLVLGIVATDRDVGLYAVAWRIALAINLLVTTVAAISAPRFAALHARDDRAGLRRAGGETIALVAALAVVPMVAMAMFPRAILGLLGDGFEAAATTLRLLLIGQAAAVLSAGTAELLGMTDHAATLRRINLLTLAVMTASLALLGRWWGSEGAAAATALTLAANGAATTIAIRRHLGFVPVAGLLRR